MTILDTIIENKRIEVMKRKRIIPLDQLIAKPLYKRVPLKVNDYFSDTSPNIIAEFKRKSPSKGVLNSAVLPIPIVDSYKKAGASAVSILTDRDFFGGSFQDLERSKIQVADIPLLRKDFMIDPYQIHEAKAYGADIILLIAAVLGADEIAAMATLAVSMGLTVFLEVHNEEEIEKWIPEIGMIGVNNRDLATFKTDIERSFNLFQKLPVEAIKISESGLQDPEEVNNLFAAGYQGFLMGERFMTSEDPGKALSEFISILNA